MNVLVLGLLMMTGCSTVVSQAQIDQLDAQQKDSFYASIQPELLPSADTGSGQLLTLEVNSGKILIDTDFEVLSGGQLVIAEGKCDSLMLKSIHHARVLKVCFDDDKIRIGTGLHVRHLPYQNALKYGLRIENFLTDEDDGIYSLDMQLRVS
ncbi:MAG: hypothetical protein FJ186_02325 [Gammaproteobacteria bacterium]|jgi:hypothetical protein|nr:hypothetical protein [Gammaproteobacteria bacterium]